MQCTILCGVRNKSPSMRCTPLLLAISTVYPFPYHGLLYSGRSPVYFLATSLPCSPSLGETESDRVRQSQTCTGLSHRTPAVAALVAYYTAPYRTTLCSCYGSIPLFTNCMSLFAFACTVYSHQTG